MGLSQEVMTITNLSLLHRHRQSRLAEEDCALDLSNVQIAEAEIEMCLCESDPRRDPGKGAEDVVDAFLATADLELGRSEVLKCCTEAELAFVVILDLIDQEERLL